MPQELDADAVRRWAALSAERLAEQSDRIDALNVFPVADADTGSNLCATAAGGLAAVARIASSRRPADVLRAWSQGAVLAARGNSGVLLGQYLAGFADGCRESADAAAVAAGLRAGALRARTAVSEPVAGTFVSVADAAAQAESTGLADLVTAAATLAHAALRATTAQLPALARAGVVDAGGLGLVIMLDALVEVVAHARTPVAAPVIRPGRVESGAATAPPNAPRQPPGTSWFEVQYLLDVGAGDDGRPAEGLRRALEQLGDSVALGRAPEGPWSVHVHLPEQRIGAAIEAGIAAGRPYRIEVSALPSGPGGAGGEQDTAPAAFTVLALVAPGGLAAAFAAENAVVVTSGADGEISVDEVVRAIGECPTGQVVILPDGAEGSAVAIEAATRARSLGRRAIVVPTRSPVQGLAALAVHDPARDLEDDVVAMAEAAAATRHAEVLRAEREALTSVGVCQPGDLLGLIDGEVVEIGHGLLAVGLGLLDRLLGIGAELITIVVGAQAPEGTGDVLRAHVGTRSTLTDVSVYSDGPHHALLMIGAE